MVNERTCPLSYWVVTCLILIQHSQTDDGSPRDSGHRPNALISDLVGLGKGQRYVDAVTYDIIRSMVGAQDSYLQSLLEFTETIPSTTSRRYPCSVFGLSALADAEEFQNLVEDGVVYHNFFANSSLCGKIATIFAIAIPSDIHIPMDTGFLQYRDILPWNWHIYANPEFKINITFLYMYSTMTSQCETLQAMVIDSRDSIDIDHVIGVYCPNFPVMSFYSTQNVVHIALRPAPRNLALFYKSRYLYENYANCSFEYQVHENDFQIQLMLDRAEWQYLTDWHMVTYHYLMGVSYHGMMLGVEKTGLNSSHQIRVPYPTDLVTHRSKWSKAGAAFQSKTIHIHLFHIRAYLGDAVTVSHGRQPCICYSGTKNEITFFDGPPVNFMSIEYSLPLIYTWECEDPLVLTTNSTSRKIMSSVGDMAILVRAGDCPAVNERLGFSIMFEAGKPQADTTHMHNLTLETNHSSITLSLQMEHTFMHLVAVHAPIGSYVQLTVQDIEYHGFFQVGCTLGGLFIATRKERYTLWSYVGSVCSSHKARHFLDTYKDHGMPLGKGAFIVLKQYSRLSSIRAVLTFSVDRCPGLFNFKPYEKEHIDTLLLHYHNEQIVRWKASLRYFQNGTNSYYTWLNTRYTFHMDFGKRSRCFRLNYFALSHLTPQIEVQFQYQPHIYLHLYSTDQTRPVVASVAYYNPDPTVQNLQDCFPNGLRLLADNRNDEPYSYLMNQGDVYSDRIYNAKIKVDVRCLLFGGSFTMRWEQRRNTTTRVCFNEIGAYMYDRYHPVIPQSYCGAVVVHLHGWLNRRLSLQRPLIHDRCCHHEVLIEIPDGDCVRSVNIYQTARHSRLRLGYVVQRWYITKTGRVHLTWRGMCRFMWPYEEPGGSGIESCMDMIVDATTLCHMRLTYRASLTSGDFEGRLPKIETTGNWNRLCLDNAYYSVPTQAGYLSWSDAQDLCRKDNGNLASISTEEEWKLISRNGLIGGNGINTTLLPVAGIRMFYIGYRTGVSYNIC